MKVNIKPDGVLFIIVAALLAWVYFVLPPLGIYSNDGGVKYIQMKAFAQNHQQSSAIEYVGSAIGIDAAHVDPDSAYFSVRDERFYCNYRPLFTFLTSLFYPALGDRVIHLLPLLSFFLSLLVLSRTLRMLIKPSVLYYVLLAGFLIGSPLFLYSITFWEHMPAVFLITAALYYITRYFERGQRDPDIFIGSFLVGLSIFFRSEMAFLIAAFAVSAGWVFFKREKRRTLYICLSGLGLAISSSLLLNIILYGSLLSPHVLYHLFSVFSPMRALACAAALLTGCLIMLSLNSHKEEEPRVKFYNLLAACWLGIILVFFRRSPIAPFFIGFPLVYVLFFNVGRIADAARRRAKENPLAQVLLPMAIIYISLTAVGLHRNPDLSVRYLLALVPLVLIFVATQSDGIMRFKPFIILISLFVAAGLLLNSHSLKDDILRYKYYNAQRVKFLGGHTGPGDIVIFEHSPLMHHCAPLFFERVFIVSKNMGGDIGPIYDMLKAKGVRRAYFWVLNPYRYNGIMKLKGIRTKQHAFKHRDNRPHYLIEMEWE
ncbi:MAG: hypothetical protein HQ558_05820 [Candidatus Omnitrophica bacterium]|nr:hypothetical protein [Candidatus Omnitrophota bacterium]